MTSVQKSGICRPGAGGRRARDAFMDATVCVGERVVRMVDPGRLRGRCGATGRALVRSRRCRKRRLGWDAAGLLGSLALSVTTVGVVRAVATASAQAATTHNFLCARHRSTARHAVEGTGSGDGGALLGPGLRGRPGRGRDRCLQLHGRLRDRSSAKAWNPRASRSMKRAATCTSASGSAAAGLQAQRQRVAMNCSRNGKGRTPRAKNSAK